MRLRIALIAPGGSIHTRRWIEFFVRRGHTVGLISYGPSYEQPEGVEVLLELPGLGQGRALWTRVPAFARAAVDCRRALHRFHPDVVHAHYLSGPGWLGYLAGVRPLVLGGWGSDVLVDGKKPFARRVHSRALAHASAATSDAQSVADGLITLGMPADKVHVILWGVDTSLFAPTGDVEPGWRANADQLVVLAIRGIRPVQRPDQIVRAFAALVAGGTDAVLGLLLGPGHPTMPDDLAQLIDELGISGQVRIVPPREHGDLPALFRAADICVSVPSTDGTSVAVMEAMACGRAVIASEIPANHALIEDGVTGRRVSVEGFTELASVLGELAGDAALRRRLGEAARAQIVREADSSVTLALAEDLYLAVVAEAVSRA